MLPVIAASVCSAFAAAGALSRLRAVCKATAYDLPELSRALAGGDDAMVQRLAQAHAEEGAGPWEGALIRGIARARNEEEARAAANEVLLDAEALLGWGAHIPAASARIALFGAMLAAAMLLIQAPRLTMEVMDIVGIGAAGTMISLFAGGEASKRAKSRRKEVDRLVDRLMRARGFGEQEGAGGRKRTDGGEPE